MKHQELRRAADLGVLRIGVVTRTGSGVGHEHQEPGRLERGQPRLGAACRAVAGDDLGVEGSDALLARVRGSVVLALGARVAAVPVEGGRGGGEREQKKETEGFLDNE